MALHIEQGPLPLDGQSINPAEFLEAWVNQTTISNLGPGAFVGSDRQFVFSATEPPELQDRVQGQLWFKRGEGILYIWDRPDSPSGLTFANKNWIAIGGRKDIWLKAMEHRIPAFAPVQLASSLSGTSLVRSHQQAVFDRWFFPAANSNGQTYGCITEVVFIALDTTSSGRLFRAVEFGFTSGLMHSGQTGIGGPIGLEDNGWSLPEGRTLFENFFPRAGAFVRRDPTHATNPGIQYNAHAVGSSATNPGTYWLQSIFMRPLPPLGVSIRP